MKFNISVLACLFVLFSQASSFAQKASINDIPTDQETTISIKKGSPSSNSNQAEYQITEGNGEIAGDAELMSKTARESWKKACKEWKEEVKDLNKENQVLILNCNNPICSKTGGESVCVSTGTYKLKVRVK